MSWTSTARAVHPRALLEGTTNWLGPIPDGPWIKCDTCGDRKVALRTCDDGGLVCAKCARKLKQED
jgi:hypothetical protein